MVIYVFYMSIQKTEAEGSASLGPSRTTESQKAKGRKPELQTYLLQVMAYTGTVGNDPKLETAQLPINTRMSRETVVSSYNELL